MGKNVNVILFLKQKYDQFINTSATSETFLAIKQWEERKILPWQSGNSSISNNVNSTNTSYTL